MLKKIALVAMGLFTAYATANTAAVQSAGTKVRPRIVGGTPAEVGEFPFIVSLQVSGSHFCGGSLIAKHWVLTAAHCGTPDQVIIGMTNQKNKAGVETFTPKRAIIHPLYDENEQDYDFELIELDHDSTFAGIALNVDSKIAESGALATAAGWGALSAGSKTLPDDLMKVDVPLVTNADCDKVSYPGQITDRMICAGYPQGGKDACQGDSGGPLIVRDANGVATLVGIVSWGEGCASPQKFGVYANVAAGASWVAENAR